MVGRHSWTAQARVGLTSQGRDRVPLSILSRAQELQRPHPSFGPANGGVSCYNLKYLSLPLGVAGPAASERAPYEYLRYCTVPVPTWVFHLVLHLVFLVAHTSLRSSVHSSLAAFSFNYSTIPVTSHPSFCERPTLPTAADPPLVLAIADAGRLSRDVITTALWRTGSDIIGSEYIGDCRNLNTRRREE
ncbi:hypothetical protein NUW58_g5189 [Xylaria curta]|uniref:Uncharacterized protein n=1 Tax=Xylaria curta TaxID=42375 RepID=A0ACC1P518_9PEZI|nr:hypothetical protein NUW58_g5189 [Xylaria curta]